MTPTITVSPIRKGRVAKRPRPFREFPGVRSRYPSSPALCEISTPTGDQAAGTTNRCATEDLLDRGLLILASHPIGHGPQNLTLSGILEGLPVQARVGR